MPNPMCTVFPTVTRYTQYSNLLSFTFAWLNEWSKKLPPTLPIFSILFLLGFYIPIIQLFVPIGILWWVHQIKLGILFSPISFTNLCFFSWEKTFFSLSTAPNEKYWCAKLVKKSSTCIWTDLTYARSPLHLLSADPYILMSQLRSNFLVDSLKLVKTGFID